MHPPNLRLNQIPFESTTYMLSFLPVRRKFVWCSFRQITAKVWEQTISKVQDVSIFVYSVFWIMIFWMDTLKSVRTDVNCNLPNALCYINVGFLMNFQKLLWKWQKCMKTYIFVCDSTVIQRKTKQHSLSKEVFEIIRLLQLRFLLIKQPIITTMQLPKILPSVKR